jgi:acetoin:2,6-dichlorophenolindophenol oxidoreductase subunit alpha
VANGNPERQSVTDAPDRAELRRIYEIMATIALVDATAITETKAGRLKAAYYPVHGMEAACAGFALELRPTDQLVSTYRNMADALAKGASLVAVLSEIYGTVGGVSHGKGGPMHLHDLSVGFMTTTGIVGSGLPIATGLGLAARLDGSDRVVAVTFGDGATSIGAYHEAINLASLWKLPVVFVCQNNQWAEHTRIEDYAPVTELADRAAAYGVATAKVDGFDPLAVRTAMRSAIARARAGDGPSFLELVTYRLTGHTATTDYSYMPTAELDEALTRDPRKVFRQWLATNGHFDERELAEFDQAVEREVAEAFHTAQNSPAPEHHLTNEDVYATVTVSSAQ